MSKEVLTRVSALALVAALSTGCGGSDEFDTSTQMGPEPVLPEPTMSLLPISRSARLLAGRRAKRQAYPTA